MTSRSASVPRLAALLAVLAAPGCMVRHVEPYSPISPVTADAAAASTNCFESATPAERLACADPTAAAANRRMTQAYQARLRDADIFGRDVLLATQREFLAGLDAACALPAEGAPPAAAAACLAGRLDARAGALLAWHDPRRAPGAADATAQYLRYRAASGAAAFNQGLCGPLAEGINAAIARSGGADPGAIPGAREIAGTHGPQAAEGFAVALFDANAFGGFQRRARGLARGGADVLDPLSLGQLLQRAAENKGARFSDYASQTGDYGALDVFAWQGRTLALISDAWGYTTPAAPGEFAHAGVWDVSAGAVPLCLFDTFQMPAAGGVFDRLPAFTPWRAKLDAVRASAAPLLSVTALRDQAQIRNETAWMLLHAPLLAAQQARVGGWTAWLRLRHDAVLDALYDWSTKSAGNKAVFDDIFRLMKPAAQDLVDAYQQRQALDAKEATEAAGIAVMELLYGATETIAPTLGADPAAPANAVGQKPRYPILAAPS